MGMLFVGWMLVISGFCLDLMCEVCVLKLMLLV